MEIILQKQIEEGDNKVIYKCEIKKLLSSTKIHIVIVAMLVICSIMQVTEIRNQIGIQGATEEGYQEYMKKLEGPLTKEKERYIEKEKNRLESAIEKKQEMEDLYQEDKISEEEYMSYNDEYIYAQSKTESFDKVEQKYGEIKKNGGWFVYDTCWKLLLSSEVYNSILLLVVVIMFSMYMGNEYSSGMWQYLESSKLGGKKTLITKCVITEVVTFILTVVFNVVRFMVFEFNKSIPLKSAPICSIEGFYNINSKVKINAFCIEGVLIQSFIMSIIAMVTVLIAYYSKNGMTALMIVGGIYVAPLLIKNHLGGGYGYTVCGIVNPMESAKVLKNSMMIQWGILATTILVMLAIGGICKFKNKNPDGAERINKKRMT